MADTESLQWNINSMGDITDGTRLVCPLCLKPFHYPRILPCMDTFCHTCLTMYLRHSAPKRSIYGYFECPVCKTKIYVPVQRKGVLKCASIFPINTSALTVTNYSEHSQPSDTEKAHNSSMTDDETRCKKNSYKKLVTTSPIVIHEASSKTTLQKQSREAFSSISLPPKSNHEVSFNTRKSPTTNLDASCNTQLTTRSLIFKHETSCFEAKVPMVVKEVNMNNNKEKESAQTVTPTGAHETNELIQQSIKDNSVDAERTIVRTEIRLYSPENCCKACLKTACKGCTHSKQFINVMLLESTGPKMKNSLLPSCFHQLFKCAEHFGTQSSYVCHDHSAVCCVRCKSMHRKCKQFTKLGQHIFLKSNQTSPRNMFSKLFQVVEEFSKLIEINESNLQVCERQIRDMPHKISSLEGRINDVLFESLSTKIKKVGSRVLEVESERKLDEIRICKSLVASIRLCTNILGIVTNMGTMEELFIVINKLEQKLLKYKKEKERIMSQMKIVTMEFQLNPLIRDFMVLDENDMVQLQVEEQPRNGLVESKLKANGTVMDTHTTSGIKRLPNVETIIKYDLPHISYNTERSEKSTNNKINVNMKNYLPQMNFKSNDVKTNNGEKLQPTSKISNNKLILHKTSKETSKNKTFWVARSSIKLSTSDPNKKVIESDIDDHKSKIPFKIETYMAFIAITPINYDGKSRFTGATFLLDDQILLVDNENRRCCLYDSSCLFRSVHYLPFPPQSVCHLSKGKVAIAVPTCQVIQMLRVKNEMDQRERIQIDFRCWAVAALNSDELAISGFTEESVVCCWGIYTTKGKKIKYQELEAENKGGGSSYIAVNKTKSILYISFSATDTVYSFGIDGKLRFSYVRMDLKTPHGVDVDQFDSLFILGWTSRNLHIVNSEGICLKVLRRDIPVSPRQIAFSQSKDKFIVTHGKHFSEDCFILSIVEKQKDVKQ